MSSLDLLSEDYDMRYHNQQHEFQPDEYDDRYGDEHNEEFERQSRFGAWGASLILHTAILGILATIVALQSLSDETVPTASQPQDLREPPPVEVIQDIPDVPIVIDDVTVVTEDPVMEAELTLTDVVLDTDVVSPSS